MKKEMIPKDNFSDLRKRAEKIIDNDKNILEKLHPAEIRKLIHELNVHQIELEMQNNELRRAELELKKTQAEYFNLYNLAPVGYFILSNKKVILKANQTGASMLGLERASMTGEPFSRFISKDSQDTFYLSFNRLIKEKISKTFELKLVKKDHTFIYAQMESQAVQDDDGNYNLILMSVTDITGHKRIEEALLKSDKSLSRAQEVAQIGSWDWNIEANILTWSDKTYRQFGFKPGEITPTYEIFKSFVHPDDLELANQSVEQALNENSPYSVDVRMIRKDGTKWIMHAQGEVYRNKDGKAIRFIGTQQDITKRKQMEDELQRYRNDLEKLVAEQTRNLREVNEELRTEIFERKQVENTLHKYKHIVSSSTDMLALLDKQYKYIAANKAYMEAFQLTPEQLIGNTVTDVFGEEFFNTVIRPNADRCLCGEEINYQNWFNYPAFGRRYMEITYYPYNSVDNKVMGFVVHGRNITKRKQAEDALRESEEKFATLYNNAAIGLFRTRILDGKLLEINQKYAELAGYSTIEECMDDFVAGERYVDPNVRKQVIQNLKEQGKVQDYEAQIKRRDGSELWVNFYAQIYPEHGYLEGGIVDITARKQVEEEKQRLQNQLQQSYKMRAIGTLAGGIAHKFNNSLSVIMGNIELFKMANPDSINKDKYADQMLASVQSMANLSYQLLAYSEGGKYQAKIISLTDLIDSTLSIVNRKIASAIRVETDIPTNISNIEGDQTQIQMLLSAIIENAAEAIENEGRIKVMMKNEEVDGELAKKYPGLNAGSYVCLRISDNGKGMEEGTKHRIFEPFFTTNFQGRGLGLAAVYGIVKNHNGWICVDSESGKGTEVSVYLPAVDVQIKKTEEPKAEISLGTGTILLIEDEEMVVLVGRAMLEKLGYNVLVAKCGEEAINISKIYKGNIELALLDMGLPDMGGKELYPLLMEVRPNLKVLVCSGYSIDGPAQEVLSAGAQAFMQKPFAFAELSAKLKQTIERRKHKRFKIKEDSVAILKSNPSQQVQIIDISMGGLACRYDKSNALSIRLNKSDELTINLAEADFNLDNIPCKTISDVTLADDAHLGSMPGKRCGIKLGELTPNQTSQLDYFIENHTIAG